MPTDLPEARGPLSEISIGVGNTPVPLHPCPTPPPTHPLPVIPDHELIRPIGGGSYGEVWLARNALGAYRAVKIVHRHNFEHDRPFEREFEGIQKLEPISRSHEGLVDLLQVGRNDVEGYFYYVMELADSAEPSVISCQSSVISESGTGNPVAATVSLNTALPITDYSPKTVKSEVSRRDRLPLDECIQFGLSLTSALAYLHRFCCFVVGCSLVSNCRALAHTQNFLSTKPVIR